MKLYKILILSQLTALSVVFAQDGDNKRPNIVFLMTDDQNFDSMSAYGNKQTKTPHLDKLAADGVVFDKHYTTTAICMASRATVMTGKYEYKSGCNFDHGAMLTKTWETSYPVLLKKAGYFTGFTGKFGFELKETPKGKKLDLPAGDFDVWGGNKSQTAYETSKNKTMKHYAAEFPHSTLSYGAFGRDFILKAAQQDKPFCLSISFKAPHKPATPDPAFNDIYQGQTFKKPANYGRENGAHFSEQSRAGRQYKRFSEWEYDKKYDEVMAIYHQQIYAVDVALGMVREALEKHGMAENTIVIFTSDNGFLCGAHGYGSKVLPYEEASRVPLIIFDPRSESSGKKLRSDALTCNIDFAPTMLELAGVTPPADMDGKNLMKLYEDPKAKLHDSLALINAWGVKPAQALSVVTQDYKYIHWPYAANGMKVTEELYNLREDALELHNIAAINESVLKEMRAVYDKHLQHWKDHAVSYNQYQEYGIIFDRSIPWGQKEKLYIETKHKVK